MLSIKNATILMISFSENILVESEWFFFKQNKICSLFQGEFEDTKGVFRIRKPKKDRQHNGQKTKNQKDKQRSTKHYTES